MRPEKTKLIASPISKHEREDNKAPAKLIFSKEYRGFVKVTKESVLLGGKKIKADAQFDGIWVWTTNTKLPAREVALKYKELWKVEQTSGR